MKPLLPVVEERWSARMQRALHAELDRILTMLNPYRQLPPGGTTAQVLAKSSQKDYAVEWIDAEAAAGGTVDTANGPNANEFARFTDANTIEGLTVAETKTALAYTKSDVGLGNVDNTADASKPVSTAQAAAIALRASKALAFFYSR